MGHKSLVVNVANVPVPSCFIMLTSNRNNNTLYQMMLCNTTIWVRSTTASSPYIALRIGIPRIKVFGSVDRESPVMIQLRFPLDLIFMITTNAEKAKSFCKKSAHTSLTFILYGLFVEITWKDNSGIENFATNLLMPEH